MQIRILRNLAIPHLRNAIRRHLNVTRLEKANVGEPFGPFYEEILDDWISCVLSCGAAAETFLNDLMKERDFSIETQKEMRDFNLSKRTKKFFQLEFGRDIDTGSKPHQEMQIVYDLRSAVMHYQPHWDNEHGISVELEKKMPECDPNPFFGENDTFFPHRCVSSGYSYWAVESTLEFIKTLIEIGEFKRKSENIDQLERMFKCGSS